MGSRVLFESALRPFRLHANPNDPVCVLIHDDPWHEAREVTPYL